MAVVWAAAEREVRELAPYIHLNKEVHKIRIQKYPIKQADDRTTRI